MKKLLLLSALLILACSGGDDSSDNDDNSNQTFLEKYDGVVWGSGNSPTDLENGTRRYNNDLSNWYTEIGVYSEAVEPGQDPITFMECEGIEYYDLLNPENTLGFYYELIINSEDVFQFNEYFIDEFGVTQLYANHISTVINNGNTLEIMTQYIYGDQYTDSITKPRASNVINDFNDLQFPCN